MNLPRNLSCATAAVDLTDEKIRTSSLNCVARARGTTRSAVYASEQELMHAPEVGRAKKRKRAAECGDDNDNDAAADDDDDDDADDAQPLQPTEPGSTKRGRH